MEANQEPMNTTLAPPNGAGPPPRRRFKLGRAGTGIAAAAVLVIGAGTAVAANTDTDSGESRSSSSIVEQMDQMHESAPAQEMHRQMPPELRDQMEQMHREMREMMGSMHSMMDGGDGATMMGGDAVDDDAGR